MSTFPKILQDVRKRDDKARTFAPPENNDKFDKIDDLAESTLALSKLTELKKPRDFKKNILDEYESINLNRVDDLINEIGNNRVIILYTLVTMNIFILKIFLIFYQILKIIRLIILIKRKNIKKGL